MVGIWKFLGFRGVRVYQKGNVLNGENAKFGSLVGIQGSTYRFLFCLSALWLVFMSFYAINGMLGGNGIC